ncbi:PQ-loop repeat-containing protein [Francisella frigiditurris]|uniref:PQ loop repeat family protein n=1 Tax=Francisella frigiditurris TaxID=1542390 RepID=A0A1J0KSZ3_9GAMM|nr:PQ-loop repeat-containing protein [Francisella frigiditurris]APC96896.1 PQ loop repeat family protein [Francisella frigiditurris]
METIGNITLNISFILYLVLFLPQTIHNQLKHTTREISLWTHSLMIIANSLDLIYAIGFNMPWQYITVSVVLLTFLTIQQLQILNDKLSNKIFLHSFFIFSFLLIAIYFALNNSFTEKNLLIFGSISNIIYNIYWFPQIWKNFRTKQAAGFSIIYLYLSIITCSCDIVSGLTLNWPIPTIIGSLFLFCLINIQIFQYLYYKKGNYKVLLA